MLTVPVHKDVTEYKPKIIGGLTARTLLCLSAAAGSAVAFSLACTFLLHVDLDSMSYIFWIGAVPAAAIGFWRPHGMDFEKFAPLWWDHEFGRQQIAYVSASHRGELGRAEGMRRAAAAEARRAARNRPYERLRKKPGIETIAPGGELPGTGAGIDPVAAFWDGAGEGNR